MSFIYHYTNKNNKNSIDSNGLTYKKRNESYYSYGTGSINQILQKYKPSHLSEFIDRDKCIFFVSNTKEMAKNEIEIVIDATVIDNARLFAFDYEPSHLIWQDTVDAPYSGEYSGVPLEVSAKNYWDSMVSYEEYIEKQLYNNKKYEILYFDEIEPSLIICNEKKKSLKKKKGH